ncbi:MAG: response regulator [Cytophagales bacterium]|nr:response regulator [Bernardetiaceae bacterium]MDW8210027.1 response regulator [Cytophagales bacterium]
MIDLPSETPKANILIVEDDKINAFLFRQYLSDYYNVYCADSRAELANILRKISIDLIIMDINLDNCEGNGIDLLVNLRKDYPTQRFKAIALTAFTEEEYEQACKEAHFNAFCRKPLSKETLLSLVEYTLKQP